MIRVLLAIAAMIILGSAAIIVLTVAAVAVFGLRCIFGPSFNTYGEINECAGCQGQKDGLCPGCRYNPEYWEHTKYIGPSRRELKKLRKEGKSCK